MDNPLEQPAPLDPLERVQAFARDLAWGCLYCGWSTYVGIEGHSYTQREGDAERFYRYLNDKWENQPPDYKFLLTFRYISHEENVSGYLLTQKAFGLLEKPFKHPSVFISYRRESSSALGLLLVTRLKAVGIPNPFIDIDIEGGDDWKKRIETVIRGSRNFVLLLAPETLKESEWVHFEIKIALEVPDMAIIPIWHNGYTGEGMDAVVPGSRNAIQVVKESPDQYDIAIAKLLNKLGYTV